MRALVAYLDANLVAVAIALLVAWAVAAAWLFALTLRLKRMEAFWNVVGELTDAELTALETFRRTLDKLRESARTDSRVDQRLAKERSAATAVVISPAGKKGRSSDSLK